MTWHPERASAKKLGNLRPTEYLWLISSLFLKGIENCEMYIILEIKTAGFYFISKYYSKFSSNHIQRCACRHARSSCCSVSSDRLACATTSPAKEWGGLVYLKVAGVVFLYSVRLLPSVNHEQNNNVSVVVLIRLYT